MEANRKEVSYSWYFKLALLECNVFQEIKLEPEREVGGQVKEVSYSWYFKFSLLECNVFQDITKVDPEKDLDLSILKLEAAIRPATSHNQQMVAAFMGSAAGQITYTMFE